MSDPDRPHTTEPAEGDRAPGRQVDHRTPHPQEPAEGEQLGEGADTPDTA
jgi:hypothetical protein